MIFSENRFHFSGSCATISTTNEKILGPEMSEELSPPRLKAPAGMVDTAIHIYDSKYPIVPTATFKPPAATVADYKKVCARVGIARTIVVQPTAYGTDNRCTLESIEAIGRSARAASPWSIRR